MTSDISSRSRMRRKSHVRFCRRVERSDPLGLVIGAKSHKRVLICLLNSILNGKPRINDISLDPNEYKKTSPDGKSIRLDIAATSDDGTIFNIEIQCKDEGNIGDRASFYQSKLREGKLKSGDDYSSIPNIISIWISADSLTHRKGCVSEIVSMYKDNGVDPIEIASEKMRQFIIELTKLEATPKRFLNDMFTVWMQFIRDPNSIPPEFLNIPEVKEAMDELTHISADPETRAEYDARVREMNRIYAGQTVKYKEGLEEGEKIGAQKERAKAEAEKKAEKIESARKMLSKGLEIQDIADFTGLSLAEIEILK